MACHGAKKFALQGRKRRFLGVSPVLGVFCRGCGMSKGALGEFCIACGIDAWLSDGKQCDKSLDWRPPRGLRGVAGLRDGAPSEARGADGERAGRPRGGRRSGGAVGSVDYRNDKFADVGLSASRRTEIWQASRRPESWWATANTENTNGGTDMKNRRPEGCRLSVRHGGLEPSTR